MPFWAFLLCLLNTSKAGAANRYYKCAVTSDVTVTLTGVTQNKFTVTFSQKGKNTAEYSSKPTGGIYSTSVQLVLESKDRTLEGTYSSKNDSGDDKINCTASASGSYVLNGTTKRYIRTGSTAPVSTFTIEKDAFGNYFIGEGTLCVYQSSDNYTYYYSYLESKLLTEGIDPEPHAFAYTPLSDCDKPTGLTNNSLEGTSATFSWTSSESAWQYVCLPSATTLTDALWTSNKVSVNTKSATVSGLSPETEYTFYVLSNCGGSGTSSIASIDFSIPCSVISHSELPWSENFNACTTGEIAPCWREKNSGDASVKITTYNYHGSSGKSLRLTGGTSSKRAIVIFPEFEDDIKTLALSFWYRADISNEYDDYGTPELGYIANPNNAGTFQKIQDLPQTSWAHIVNFTVPDNTPDGAYFAIRYTRNTTGTTGYTDIDDITVTAKPSCSKPTGVAVTADSETADGATITWEANGMSNWKLQVSEGDAASWGEEIAVATNSKVLTGLKANTLYYVRVKADCGGGSVSEWSDNVSFTTLCGIINVSAASPWSIDFEGLSDHVIPQCWDNSASTTSSSWGAGYIWGTYKHSGNTMLAMNNSTLDGGTALMNTPEIAIPNDGNAYELAFDYANMAIAGNNMTVKISANGGAFIDKGTYYPSGNVSSYPGAFSNAVISLADYSGQTIKIQFFANPTSGTSSEGGAMFVDNVSVHKVSSCAVPTSLSAGNLSANSARISWTAGGSESAWRLQYRAADGDWSAEQAVSGSAQRDLTGLSANTEYFVRVKAYCDAEDQSNWSDVLSFTTLCAAAAMPFSEEFSSASELPACWEATPASGTYRWSAYEKSGAYSVQLRTGSSGEATLRLPAINLSEDAILRFEWKNVNGTQVNLYISTDGGSTKTLLPNDLSGVHADWTTKIFDLSAYTGETALIYFVANFSTINQYAYLDDVEVIARPCDMILNIQAAPITGGATISWNGNVKKLQYKTGSAAWISETIESANYAGPKTITGLTPARTYQVRLLPACSAEEESNWTAPVYFITSGIESIPYSNDFESETPGEAPFNWSRISSSDYPQVSHDAYAYKEGESSGYQGNSIKFTGVNDQIIVLPEFDATLSDLKIAFHYRNRDCTMQLGYVASDGVTFTALETLPNQTGYGELPYEKDLYGIDASASRLAIRYTNAGASALAYVDNVNVDNVACSQPTALSVSDVTANSAHISWAASARATETGYQYIRREWSEDAPNWSSATLVLSSVHELDLSGLTPNKDYEFYLRSYCGAGAQSSPVKIEFRTLMKDEVFEDVASATDNETRLAALVGQTVNVTIKRPLPLNGDYSTICLPFNLSASQIADPECPLHGFVIKEFEHSEEKEEAVDLYLRQVTSIEAGKPYFVRYAGATSDARLTPLTFRNVKITRSTPVELAGSDGVQPHGIFNPHALTGGDNTTFFLSSNNTLYWPSANGTINGFRAYVHIEPSSALGRAIHRGAPVRIREAENSATGIESVLPSEVRCQKVLREGQIIIIRDGKEFNAQGIRLQ